MRGRCTFLLLGLGLLTAACGGVDGVATVADGGAALLDGGLGPDRKPVPVPGGDRTVDVLTEVTLDASASYDPDGEPITDYQWQLRSAPESSTAQLRDPAARLAHFTPDKVGVYRIGLLVYGEKGGSGERAEFTLTADGRCCSPLAAIRGDAAQDVGLGGSLSLDGTPSRDPRNQMLTYRWTLRRLDADGGLPGAGSGGDGGPAEDGGPLDGGSLERARLDGAEQPVATFTPDPAQPRARYLVELRVTNAQQLASTPAAVSVRVRNSRAVITSVSGPDGTVSPGQTVALSAAATDGDGDALTYRWRLVEAPMGAALTAQTPSSGVLLNTVPAHIADYRVEVIATDGFEDSAPFTRTVSTGNGPPVVSAGADQSIPHSCEASGRCTATATVHGLATDPDTDVLTYTWDVDPFSTSPLATAFATPADLATNVTVTSQSGPIASPLRLRFRARDSFHDYVAAFTTVTITNQPPTVTAAGPALVVPHVAVNGERLYQAVLNLAADGRDPEYQGGAATAPYLAYQWSAPASGERPDALTSLQYDSALNAGSRSPRITLFRDCRDGSCDARIGGTRSILASTCGGQNGAAGAPFIGMYTFRVQTIDPNLATGSASLPVFIGNCPPTASITGPAGVAAGGSAILHSASTDPDGDPLDHQWIIAEGVGTGATLTPSSDGKTATFQASSATAGQYRIGLAVKDDFGAVDLTNHLIAVNAPPTVSAPATLVTGHTCSASGQCSSIPLVASGTASDPEGDTLTLEWRSLASTERPLVGCNFTPRTSTTTTVACLPGSDGAISGTYSLQLCAKDPLHDFACAPVAFTVTNQPPTARIDGPPGSTLAHTQYSGATDRTASIALTATATDPEYAGSGAPPYLRYRWRMTAQGDPQATVTFATDVPNPTVSLRRSCPCTGTAPLLGSYAFELVTTDPNGAESVAATKTLTITNQRPAVNLTAAPAGRVRAGTSVLLSASATDGDSDQLSYAWELVSPSGTGAVLTPNGSNPTQATLTTATGATDLDYVVRVHVYDGYETTAQDITVFTNRPPVLSSVSATGTQAYEDCSGAQCSAQANLTASVSDVDDSQLTYAWTVGTAADRELTVTNATSVAATLTVKGLNGKGATGTYPVTLTVTDPAGNVVARSVSYTVSSRPPSLPTLTVHAATVYHSTLLQSNGYRVISEVTLTASARDPESGADNTNLTWAWGINSRPAPDDASIHADIYVAPLVPGQPATAIVRIYKDGLQFQCPVTAPITGYTGTWGFVARAIDPNGLASELSAEATTTLVNRAPKDVFAGNLIASQDHQYLGGAQPYRASIPFTGGSVGSDPDGDLPCYQWEFEGSAVAGACLWDGTTCAASYTLPAASVGTLELRGQQGIASAAGVQHRVCLRATDWFGSTFVSCRGVTVGDRPPSISLSGPTALNIDTSRAAANTACNLVCGVHAYTVTATVSDPDGDPVNLSWLRSVVGACTVSTPADCAAGCSASVTVTCPGTYSGGGSASFTATATDPFGVSTTSAPLGTSFPPHCLGVNACP